MLASLYLVSHSKDKLKHTKVDKRVNPVQKCKIIKRFIVYFRSERQFQNNPFSIPQSYPKESIAKSNHSVSNSNFSKNSPDNDFVYCLDLTPGLQKLFKPSFKLPSEYLLAQFSDQANILLKILNILGGRLPCYSPGP